MSDEEAENFHVDDEDKSVSRWNAARQIKWGLDYIRDHYGPGATPPEWPGDGSTP